MDERSVKKNGPPDAIAPKRKDERKALGAFGEAQAAAYLQARGYRLLARNWRCRTGELDLVAEDGDTIVFVEVRTRSVASMGRYGTAYESVNYRKRHKVRETGAYYVHAHRLYEKPVRFDAVAVLVDASGDSAEIEHVRDAF